MLAFSRSRLFVFCAPTLIVALLLSTGCIGARWAEQSSGEARITSGPCARLVANDKVIICWESDRPSVGQVLFDESCFGVLSVHASVETAATTHHQMPYEELRPGRTHKFQISMADTIDAVRKLRLPSRNAGRVRVGFAGRYPSGTCTAADEALCRNLDLFCQFRSIREGEQTFSSPGWITTVPCAEFEECLGKSLLCDCASGATMPAFYSIEYGPLHLAILNTLNFPEKDSPLYFRILEDLSSARKGWKVVLLTRPVFSPEADMQAADLADLFARQQVSLVLALGIMPLRTMPIGFSAKDAVRYIVMGADVSESQADARPRWVADRTHDVCFGILDVTRAGLVWREYDNLGRLCDELRLAENGANWGQRFFTLTEIIAAGRGVSDKEAAKDASINEKDAVSPKESLENSRIMIEP